MNAGLPGTGIGGLFYIAGALWMPVDAVYRRARHGRRGPSLPTIALQSGIAVGILAALWATGWTLGVLLAPPVPTPSAAGAEGGSPSPAQVVSLVKWMTVLGSAGVLLMVISAVQVLRLTAARPERSKAAPDRPDIGPGILLPEAAPPPLSEVA